MKNINLCVSLLATVAICAPAWGQDMPVAASPPVETAPAVSQAMLHVPAGSIVELQLTQELSSKTAKAGDVFPIVLVSPIKVDGVVVVPAGVTGQGEVIDVGKPGMGGKPGTLVVAARYLDFNGQRIKLKAFKVGAGGSSNAEAALVASFAVGVFALAITGGQVVFPVGLRANAKTAEDLDLPAAPPVQAA